MAESKNEERKVVSDAKQEQKKENLYGDIPAIPVVEAVEGIRYDFNSGLRVYFPKNGKKYHLKFVDTDTEVVMHNSDAEPGTIVSSLKKYFIRYRFEITRQDTGEKIYEHTLDLRNKKVIVQFPVHTIGDSIGWFSYIERFQKKNECNVVLVISDFLKNIVEKQYHQFKYISKGETVSENSYASYYIGLFFKGDTNMQPMDFRAVGLHRTAGYILGLRTKEELEDIPVRLDLSAERAIKEKYVVISCKASAQCKFWNNPFGWDRTIRFLRDNGYKVVCIDKDRIYGKNMVFNQLPWGVEDYTGDILLQERINVIKDADFFIGLDSGLSWLAWCCNVPVVMISGFTLPFMEFYTPYRVINFQACNGCWEDPRVDFDHNDYFWCPRHKDDDRKYECSKLITPEQVIGMIKTIPTFRPVRNKK